jgi:hypothetical protein
MQGSAAAPILRFLHICYHEKTDGKQMKLTRYKYPSKSPASNCVLNRVKTTLCLLFFLSCILTHPIRGQVLQPAGNKHHTAGASFGFDNNLIGLNLGYAYYQSKYKSSAFTDFTQGSSLIGSGDFRTQLGLQTWQGSFKNFTLKNSIALVYTRSVNKAGNYSGLGISVVSNPGFRFAWFGFGADLQYSPFLATYIRHSAYYRQYYYEEVRDGWYRSTAQNLRAGLYMAAQLGKKRAFELNLKGGYQSNGKYDKLIPNIYAIAGVNKPF